jgi:hypothetical protein
MSKKSTQSVKSSPATKAEIILKLLRRNTGASVADLAKATGWQHHSVQGFISGTLRKKRGLEIRSEKPENKERRYFIEEKSQ